MADVEMTIDQQGELTLTDREWYIVKFEDGTTTMNYLYQLLRVEEDDYVVNSFLSVRSGKIGTSQKKRLFKKYPNEEIVSKGHVKKPEMQRGGKMLVKGVLEYDVK